MMHRSNNGMVSHHSNNDDDASHDDDEEEVAIKSVINGGYLSGLGGARPPSPNGFITAS